MAARHDPALVLVELEGPSAQRAPAPRRPGETIMRLFKPLHLSDRVSAGLFALRLVVGLAFVFHGYGKIVNPFGWMGPNASVPGIFQALAAVSEFGGGMAWMVGLLTPLASFGLACTMTVAVWTHAAVLGDPFVSMTGARSYELAGAYLCVAVLLLLAGPGRFSLDRAVFGERAGASDVAS